MIAYCEQMSQGKSYAERRGTLPEGVDRGLTVAPDGDPDFAREPFVVVFGERLVVGPQGADGGGADGLNGVE